MSKIFDMPSWRKELGSQIREAREVLNWTQAQLAKRVGLSRATLNYYENGTSRGLSFEKVLEIARALKKEFVVRGCTLNGRPNNRPVSPPTEQLCLRFSEEHVFTHVVMTIRPSRGVLVITSKADIA